VTDSDCDGSLESGEACTVSYTFVVAAGSPDPLANTVVVHFNPEGFPNDITATAMWSTNLFQPAVEVVKTGDELAGVGDPVDYQVVVTNQSSSDSPALVNGTVVDSLLGDLLDPANPYVTGSSCTVTLAVGESCTITATRVVLVTDPDPLPNTVTVHYNPDGFPNDITDSDDHSVNLFQPSVTVEKSGDELGKVTDPAHYVVTITNTSSDDSPDLVDGTVSDSLTGDLLDPANPFVTDTNCDGDLEAGESCTIEYEYVVQAGDPDPLVNTVEVHFHPVGFDNDITATDTHTMELFQPSVTVDKTGDVVASRGDDVDYQFVVTNTSSDDSPRLVNGTIVDSLLGDLLDPANPFVTTSDCDGTLDVGASCTIRASRTVAIDDPNPLPNTVTVHFNPDGFPNDITDNDDHSVELLPEPTVLTVPPTTTTLPEPTTSTTVGGRLPFTGGGASFAGLGLLLLAGGLALVGGTRRRRRLGTDGG